MTDKRHSDALRIADELEDSLESHDGSSLTARCQGIADDAAAELRRLHAENETLTLYKNLADEYGLSIFPDIAEMTAELETMRAKLKTHEDLGDAGSDVQLLRMGYTAARLEIESLKAQQPGAAYTALPDEREAFEAMMRSQTFDSLKRLSDGSYESYEARVGWLAWNVRASHGQAPAQEGKKL